MTEIMTKEDEDFLNSRGILNDQGFINLGKLYVHQCSAEFDLRELYTIEKYKILDFAEYARMISLLLMKNKIDRDLAKKIIKQKYDSERDIVVKLISIQCITQYQNLDWISFCASMMLEDCQEDDRIPILSIYWANSSYMPEIRNLLKTKFEYEQ